MRVILNAFVTAVAASLGLLGVAEPRAGSSATSQDGIAVVAFEPGAFVYRLSGDFERDGQAVNAPLRKTTIERPFAMMTRQVSQREYAACVADRACPQLKSANPAADLPMVGVNWQDATAYATWLSRRTGEDWSLPSDAEWAYAAGARFRDDAVPEGDSDDYAKRWLAKFDLEAARDALPKAPQPFGHFGANEHGLLDLAGNVWEWTDACYERHALDASGALSGPSTRNCNVRIAEGGHRAYMSDFIRDSRTGGCSVGVPPANLGIRLVRRPQSALRRTWRALGELVASL